jgi:hypothetical protein
MRSAILLMLSLFLLSSCWTVYREIDNNGKNVPIPIKKIMLRNFAINAIIYAKRKADPADYHVTLNIYDVPKESYLKISELKLCLSDYSKKHIGYNLLKIELKKFVTNKEGLAELKTLSELPLNNAADIYISEGGVYYLIYSFSGRNGMHRSRKLQVELSGSINGEALTKTIRFKKGVEVQLLH